MHKHFVSFNALAIPLAAAMLCAAPLAAQAATNEAVTSNVFASMVAGKEPRLAELTMFFTLMPKGGDLHHHYSGALYAEQYLRWVDKQGFCINKAGYTINVDQAVAKAERARPLAERACLSGEDTMLDNTFLSNLLQRWSDKDYHNHGAVQNPPDRQFFDTFAYFNSVASTNTAEGLQTLKRRAIDENLSYIETIFEIAPIAQDAGFDDKARAGTVTDADLAAYMTKLEGDQAFNGWIAAYLDNVKKSGAGIDDENFTLRYQPFALRFLTPSQVFSQMVSSFKLATASPMIVGVNIVGQESTHVSMRDYALHMKMYGFLKARYPSVKLALHAGELSLGMVEPEGLKFHIKDALDVAGASRIGHGMDIVHEHDPLGIMKKMRDRNIPVEVNLSSNDFILGIKDQEHPVTLFRKYGVPFVLSTDDAGVSRNNLSGEYVLFASRYQPTYGEVKKLSYDSIRYSFLADADKQRLLKALDGKFDKFEADIAKAQPKQKR